MSYEGGELLTGRPSWPGPAGPTPGPASGLVPSSVARPPAWPSSQTPPSSVSVLVKSVKFCGFRCGCHGCHDHNDRAVGRGGGSIFHISYAKC